MLPLVIVNPKSAGGSTRESWSSIASDLRAHFGPFNVAFTKAAGDGWTLARNAAAAGRDLVIACGGDGTVNEVANGILESGRDVELGVFPSGTGGDFRRSIGIPQASREAARALRDGRSRRIDVGRVAFVAHDGSQTSRCFLNVASFGLAASIIDRVKSNKALDWVPMGGVRGRASFALSTLREVVGLSPVTVRIAVEGGEEKLLRTVNLCFANARFFGGGMMIAPEAKLDDGQLDMVNIGDIRTAKVLLNAYTLYNGSHLALDEVKSSLVRSVAVRPADPDNKIDIETDGELPGRLPAVFEILPSALRVRTI